MTMIIGDVHENTSGARELSCSADTCSLQSGDFVKIFDYFLEWDNHCVTVNDIQRWRASGDPLCDSALCAVFPHSASSVGKDLFSCLEEHAARHPDSQPVTAFLDQVLCEPPTGIYVSADEVHLAHEFFLDNCSEIIQALLHYSLAGGFASPRIVRTLLAVSYLVPHSKRDTQLARQTRGSQVATDAPFVSDAASRISSTSNERTFSRLLETFQFVLDVLGCSSPSTNSFELVSEKLAQTGNPVAYLNPGGEGWRSTVNVRLLHGITRMRVREKRQRALGDDLPQNVIPINQEELAATLATFSTIPIWCLRRLHVPPSELHANAYLALWRHVGFYLGISPSILLRYFSGPDVADKFIATAALHLFSADDGEDIADAPTVPILRAASNRPPTYTSFEYNCALSRHLLGPSLALRVGLGPPSISTLIRMHTVLFLQRIPHLFAQWYPRRGWLIKRRAVLREGMARSLRWNLGMRRVSFRPRTAIKSTNVVSATQGIDEGGELAEGVKEAESIRPDPQGAAVLVRKWREVWMEMIGVCVGATAIGIGLGWSGARYMELHLYNV